jgi:hypothetical protein
LHASILFNRPPDSVRYQCGFVLPLPSGRRQQPRARNVAKRQGGHDSFGDVDDMQEFQRALMELVNVPEERQKRKKKPGA